MKLLHILPALALLPFTLAAQNSYDIALIGDMPYGEALEPAYERVIADINRSNPAFTAFIGDTKSGSTRCDDSHYTKALNWFNSFQGPVIYSIGDNEWTDCMRANNGAFNPIGRLDLIRRMMFPTNMSLGKQPIPLIRQSDEPAFALYKENAMLVKGPAVFVSIHMPGSNNNLEYKTVQGVPNTFYDNDREYTARNAANLAWLRKAFATAKDRDSAGLMILTQANMFETFLDTSIGATHSGFSDFIALLREETMNFNGQVVLVNGDTHYMRLDKPLTMAFPACTSPQGDCRPVDAATVSPRLVSFTRLEVPGSTDVHWVRCRVSKNRRNPFKFEFMIVDENR